MRKETRNLSHTDEAPVQETPEDVAVLYSWANVHGAKYRDFSASRREYRAQMRRRMSEQQAHDAEQRAVEEAKIAAEAAAAVASEEARIAAEAAAAKAEAEARIAAQTAAEANAEAERAAREEAQAHTDALARAQEYARARAQRQQETQKPHVAEFFPGAMEDPYHTAGHLPVERPMHVPGKHSAAVPVQEAVPASARSLSERIAATSPLSNPSPVRAVVPPVQPRVPAETPIAGPFSNPIPSQQMSQPVKQSWTEPAQSIYTQTATIPVPEPFYSQPEPMRTASGSKHQDFVLPSGRPAWLHESEVAAAAVRQQQASPLADTLQHSRERVASRWFALKGVFEGATGEQQEAQPVRQAPPRIPVLAVFSLAGGVGKTSIVATLGRALSSLGEKTLLTDTTSYGLLPFYFGARELRPGVVRTFTPPSGSTDAPINLVNLEMDPSSPEMANAGQDWLTEEISRSSRGANRVVVDLATASSALTRRTLRMGPIVLVPVAPDMNSVISISAVEQFFQNQTDADGRAIKVFYILNQFDASQPLHLDVREVLRQQLGDRLLPFVIRRSQAISEALAEGMTVMDYAPNSPVAEDYMNLAAWVRNVSAPASLGFRGVRWSEQR
ncbi:MAG: cellulose biosynthesis protein BcsQ [Acidobacteriaceae bacterium]